MKKIKKVDLNKDVDFKKVNEKTKSFWAEFKAFAIKGNAIDLAIGMVIGSAFTSIVNSLVKDILTPIIGAVTGGLDFSEWFIPLDGSSYATLAEAQENGEKSCALLNKTGHSFFLTWRSSQMHWQWS